MKNYVNSYAKFFEMSYVLEAPTHFREYLINFSILKSMLFVANLIYLVFLRARERRKSTQYDMI